MKRLYLVALLGIGVLALAGCRRGGKLGGNPEVVEKVATNQGADLKLTWKSVEGAEGYKVYCDGNKIWDGKDTTYTIQGSSHVCKTVEVSAFAGKDEQKAPIIDLAPESSTITGLVTHDILTGNSWVKLDFTNGKAISVRQSDVNPNAPNIGWFIFYNNSGPYFVDASEISSVGQAKMEVAFTNKSSSGHLALPKGNYATVEETAANAYHFFWADNTSTGYNEMDNNDYFGVIRVTNLRTSSPGYTADLTIYIQNKVRGLRWVKF